MSKIYSKKEFTAILNRERARSDRTGQVFSIIIFELEVLNGLKNVIEVLDHLIRQRIRSCDEIGWVGEMRLGTLLPGTSKEGAQKLADDFCDSVFPGKFQAKYIILTYPSNWIDDSQDGTRSDDTDIPQHPRVEKWAKVNETVVNELGSFLPNRMPLWKRAMDICGSILGLTLLLPVFLLIAMYIKKVSPGPVFFKQERIGFLGRPFTCWKFRTMGVNAEISVHSQYYSELMQSNNSMKKLDGNDTRVIPYGVLMRKTGLDELPQLFNVLIGDMSLIGPRPCIRYEADQYQLWQRRRFEAVPGLTGLWQVSGKNRTTFNEMMRYDISYAMKKSLLLDIGILLKTLPAVIAQVSEKL